MRDQFQKLQISSLTSWLLKNMMLLTTSGVLLTALLFGIGMWRSGVRFWDGVTGIFNLEQPEPEVDVRSLVVKQVRGASELTTSVFTMESVVPARQERQLAGYTVGATTLLYIAYGEVRAGVDLAELDASDVKVVEDKVTLELPAPRILDKKIDVTRSQVYDYDRGFLGLGPDVAPQLQTLAQQETLKKIVTTACSQGILEKANDRAELVVSKLLNTSDYKEVEVRTQPAVPGSCQ